MIWCTGSSARARALLSWACAPAAACGAVAADAGAGLGSLAAASVDVLPYWQGLQSGVAQLGVGQPGDACHGCRLQSAANGGHHGDLLSCADDPDGGGEQQRPPRAAALQPRCASSASSTTAQLRARAVAGPLSFLPRGFRSDTRARRGRVTVKAAACRAGARGVRLGPRSLTPFHPHPLL